MDELNKKADSVTQKPFDLQSFDAQVWAKEFMRIYNNKKLAPQNHSDANWIDKERMRSWFANTLMTGYDEAMRRVKKGLAVDIRQALVQGYCTERNKHKVLDPDLIEDMIVALTERME